MWTDLTLDHSWVAVICSRECTTMYPFGPVCPAGALSDPLTSEGFLCPTPKAIHWQLEA